MLDKLKNLASDTLIYGIFTNAGRFLTFLLTPFYTNYLSVDDNGELGFIFAILAFLSMIYSFGMESAFFRFYSKESETDSKKAFTHAFFTIISISFVISGCIFIFSPYIAPYFGGMSNSEDIIRIAAIIPFLDSIVQIPYAYLRLRRKALKFSLTRFILILIAVTFNILFLAVFHFGVLGVFLAQLISSALCVLILFPEILSMLHFTFDKKLFFEMLRFGLPTLPANLSAIILQVADRIIMKPMTNTHELGLYSINYKLGIPMMLFVAVFEYAWKPFYLSNFEEPDSKRLYSRILTYFTFFAAIIFLGTGLFIEYIVRLPFIGGKIINPAYWSGLTIVPIILGGYFFNGVFTNLAAGFHITKKTGYLPIAVGIAAVSNIILNIVFIPISGIYGAAWATLGAYFIGVCILYYYTKKVYPVEYEIRRVLIIIAAALIAYFLGMELTKNMTLFYSVIIRILASVLFVGLIVLFGFFNKREIQYLKNLRKFKK
ncbi:MAG: Polysacc synt protein [Ignavibacteria bacterium]|nr:Polysacc synt protein [Ignavibacteria bacterium]